MNLTVKDIEKQIRGGCSEYEAKRIYKRLETLAELNPHAAQVIIDLANDKETKNIPQAVEAMLSIIEILLKSGYLENCENICKGTLGDYEKEGSKFFNKKTKLIVEKIIVLIQLDDSNKRILRLYTGGIFRAVNKT